MDVAKDYTITIEGAKNNLFIDNKDVEQLLFKTTKGPIKGDPVAALFYFSDCLVPGFFLMSICSSRSSGYS